MGKNEFWDLKRRNGSIIFHRNPHWIPQISPILDSRRRFLRGQTEDSEVPAGGMVPPGSIPLLLDGLFQGNPI